MARPGRAPRPSRALISVSGRGHRPRSTLSALAERAQPKEVVRDETTNSRARHRARGRSGCGSRVPRCGARRDGLHAGLQLRGVRRRRRGREQPVLQPTAAHAAVLAGTEDGTRIRVKIEVLPRTEIVDGVRTRVVKETETHAGRLYEISRN